MIERIQKNVGVPWRSQTVDTFKAGDPDTPVTGVATTMMATFDVLERAAASGNNLIITHEPTFYGHLDQTADLAKENDAVLAAIQKAGIATASAEIGMLPKNLTKVEGKNAAAMLRLSEALEEHDDVQNVYSNFDVDEKELAALAQ